MEKVEFELELEINMLKILVNLNGLAGREDCERQSSGLLFLMENSKYSISPSTSFKLLNYQCLPSFL